MSNPPISSIVPRRYTHVEKNHNAGESVASPSITDSRIQFIAESKHVRKNADFTSSLLKYCLFKTSAIDRFAANLIYPLCRLLEYRTSPLASRVVDRLTLWEKYLAHRSRSDRRMTFSISFKQAHIPPKTYLVDSISRFYQLILSERDSWHNQPLNVILENVPRSRILDSRLFTDRHFLVGIVDANRSMKVLTLDLLRPMESEEQLRDYVASQVKSAVPQQRPVSAIFDELPKSLNEISGAYAEYPGAWLRMAPDRTTGGMVSSADHLVIDGSLHQLILFQTATAALISGQISTPEIRLSNHEHVVSFEIPRRHSNSEVLLNIGNALEDQGIHVRKGHDTSLLTTIPNSGPEHANGVARGRARILPVLLQMRLTNTAADVRDHIDHLNSHGISNPLAFALDRIYCGTTHPIMIRYFERFSMRVPFQSAARFLNGSALISFIPAPAYIVQSNASGRVFEIDRLTATTLRSEHGIPAILIQQSPQVEDQPARMFVSFSGSRDWDCNRRLTLLANSFRKRLGINPIR